MWSRHLALFVLRGGCRLAEVRFTVVKTFACDVVLTEDDVQPGEDPIAIAMEVADSIPVGSGGWWMEAGTDVTWTH